MSHPVIETLTELESAAARLWWTSEERGAWRDELLRRRESEQIFSLKTSLNAELTCLSVRAWDEDLLRCFSGEQDAPLENQFLQVIDELNDLHPHAGFGVTPRPGFWMSETWPEEEQLLRDALLTARNNKAFVIRCGFTTDAADVLMAADLNFSAIQIHAGHLDLFELQLLIELARDCRLSPIVSVEDNHQLEITLQTDAPHIALCCLSGEGHETAIRFVQQSIPRIPQNCTKLLFTHGWGSAEANLFGRLGINGILNLT